MVISVQRYVLVTYLVFSETAPFNIGLVVSHATYILQMDRISFSD